jgi:phosphoglycolate phosphatase
VTLFAGIPELMETLESKGYRLGIVSSSRHDTIEAIVSHYKLPVDFVASGKLFNKAQSLRDTLKNERLELSEVLYIGDEVRDVEACHQVGLDIISVTWGLNSKEALMATGAPTVDTREELLALILAS